MTNNSNINDEIDLREILKFLFIYKELIFLVTLISAIIATGYSFFLIKPTYQSTAKMHVGYSKVTHIKQTLGFYFPAVQFNEFGKQNEALTKYFSISSTGPSIEYTTNKIKLASSLLNESSKKELENRNGHVKSIINLLDDEITLLEKSGIVDSIILARISKLRVERNKNVSANNYEENIPTSIHSEITSSLVQKQWYIILIWTFLGFIFSVVIVFIRQFFFQEQK